MNSKGKGLCGGEGTQLQPPKPHHSSERCQLTAKRHFLVIDDDPTFRAVFRRVAEKAGVEVTTCSSLKEVEPAAVPRSFDAVILDYYLDDLQEQLRGTEVARSLESTPIILISSQTRCLEEPDGGWPSNIRRFVNKKQGAIAILNTATRVVAENE